MPRMGKKLTLNKRKCYTYEICFHQEFRKVASNIAVIKERNKDLRFLTDSTAKYRVRWPKTKNAI